MPIIGSVVMPHPPIVIDAIGQGETVKVKETIAAMHQASRFIARMKPDTIILSSPHSVGYQDYINIQGQGKKTADFSAFGYPQGKVLIDYDHDGIERLEKAFIAADFPAGMAHCKAPIDHGVSVPLYFLNAHYQDYQLIQVSLSNLSVAMHYRFGTIIQNALASSEKRVLWLASGDLSHCLKASGPYGFNEAGPTFDKAVVEALKAGRFSDLLTLEPTLTEAASECGLRSLIMMAGFLDKKQLETTFLSYQAPFGVGYAVSHYQVTGETLQCDPLKAVQDAEKAKHKALKETECDLVKIARDSVETYLQTHQKLVLSEPQLKQYNAPSGAFVSIYRSGQLRGCIGTLESTRETLAEEVRDNALSAAFKDPRFAPIQIDEIDTLSYSVDVLMPAETIETLEGHDVKRYGLIATYKGRKGVLLPDLTGVDTAEKQCSIVLQKAGIKENEPYRLARFEVKRYR